MHEGRLVQADGRTSPKKQKNAHSSDLMCGSGGVCGSGVFIFSRSVRLSASVHLLCADRVILSGVRRGARKLFDSSRSLLGCFLIGLYVAVRSADWVITGGNHIDRRISVKFLIGVLVVIFVYGVLRNIPAFPFTLLAPGGFAQIL